ncbi:MAG: hypothetical protein CSB24_06330 [Deltaproteobacteria bacterium]|nr:MAG: hypothetical protein CSB24_06330 [Deltaproteobacteria bacterium]
MRTSPLFKKTIVGALCFLPATVLAAGVNSTQQATSNFNNGYISFSARAGLGLATGEANEYVYEPLYNNHTVSKLIWTVDALPMAGIGATLEFGGWLELNADGWFRLADGSGTLDDYDYLDYDSDVWTDWSNSDADITEAEFLDINAGFAPFDLSAVKFNIIAGYKRDVLKWVASGGHYIYSEYGYRDSTGNLPEGPGISYKQTMEAPYIGVGAGIDLSGQLALKGRFIYSPLVKGTAIDHHFLRNFSTKDTIDNGKMYGIDAAITWAFAHNLALEGSLAFHHYDTAQGDSEWRSAEGVYVFRDGAGMDQTILNSSVKIRYSF